jgi:hypothetical protein
LIVPFLEDDEAFISSSSWSADVRISRRAFFGEVTVSAMLLGE